MPGQLVLDCLGLLRALRRDHLPGEALQQRDRRHVLHGCGRFDSVCPMGVQ